MTAVFYLACAAVAYLLGSIPTGYWLAQARGIDLRKFGSGNIGATNTFRALGKAAGAVALLGDITKGVVAVLLLPWAASKLGFVGDKLLLQILCSVAVITGHNWTIFLRFKGGKGIATSAGAMLVLAPAALVAGLIVWLATFLASRFVSLASIAAAVAVALFVWFWPGYGTENLLTLKVFVTLMAVVAVVKHRTNIRRLLAGTENRVGKFVANSKRQGA